MIMTLLDYTITGTEPIVLIVVLWSRHREETDSYNQGIGWDIPQKLFLIF